MKVKNFFLLYLLGFILSLSSCATVRYSQDENNKNFSYLNAGKPYKFTLHNGEHHKMIFSNLTQDSIIGYTSKDGTGRVSISKKEIKTSKDVRKATTKTIATGIGVAGVAGLVISSMRATQ